MIINNDNPNLSQSNLNATNLSQTQESSRTAASSSASDSSPSGDSISLSNSPDLVQQALAASSSVRQARIQELKALVANNQYNPDAEQVSRALINAHLTGA